VQRSCWYALGILVSRAFLTYPAEPLPGHSCSLASGIAEGTGCPHYLVTPRQVAIAPHDEFWDSYEEVAMASASRRNQERIIANQKRIIYNQRRLLRILDNEEKIIRNQKAIIKNQKKILANQSKIYAK
jgi:hypothetical protein